MHLSKRTAPLFTAGLSTSTLSPPLAETLTLIYQMSNREREALGRQNLFQLYPAGALNDFLISPKTLAADHFRSVPPAMLFI